MEYLVMVLNIGITLSVLTSILPPPPSPLAFQIFNPYPSKLNYLNFQPLEVVARYRDPQIQVAENYSYLFNMGTHICKSWYLDTHFIPNNSDLVD